ncbi:MAG: acyltransferase [Cellvibrio sp.]|uniref:acyltransferase family protein n=1 Tax=Cellvibrio sp. TaxID=1965322 RepID=UPI00271A0DC7|nr:acyltransferase [Cellvibrio sp.]
MSLAVEGYKQPSRVEALDSARGWAILGVIAIHVSQAAPLPAGILHALAVNGDMGVELFYVLSAFSLTMMLHARAMAGQHNLIGYFIRRFFRIAPMFWVALLLATLMFFGRHSFWSPDGIGWTEVGLTAIFLHGIYPDSINAVIPGGWSVAVEVMFYLVLPVFCKYATTAISALKWLLVSVGIYFLFGNVAQAYFNQTLPENARYLADIYAWYMSFPAQLPVFMMGILAFFVVKEERFKPVYAYAIACACGLLLISMPIQAENHMLPRHFLWAAVFALFIVANVQRPFFLFDNPLMRLFGRISYSAYLLHFFVLIYVGKIFRHAMIQAEIKFALLYFVVVGITYFMAAWSYRAIELPGMKIGGQLSRRFEISPV